jgi:hypothetical protein
LSAARVQPICRVAFAGLIWTLLALPDLARGADDSVELHRKGDALDVTIGGKPFTVYNFAESQPKPYFWPVRAPSGEIITRPLENPRDHKHHRGIWFSVDEVNGVGFWKEEGKIQNVSVQPIVAKGNPAKFEVVNHWLGKNGKPILTETTLISIFSNRMIAYDARLTAGAQPVTFNDTKEGLFAFRMVDSMHEPARERGVSGLVGGGKVVNAEGLQGSSKAWGKTSDWVDYDGPVQGKTVGVAIFDNPHNFRRSRYHVRNYGLFSISPFGERDYTNKKNSAAPVHLKPGETLRLQYGIYIHDGDTKAADVAGTYRQYLAEANGPTKPTSAPASVSLPPTPAVRSAPSPTPILATGQWVLVPLRRHRRHGCAVWCYVPQGCASTTTACCSP